MPGSKKPSDTSQQPSGVPPPGEWGGADSYAARLRLARIVKECLEDAGSVEIEGLGVFRMDENGRARFEAYTQPRAFLAYAVEDLPQATRLYQDLKDRGIDVWMDRMKLLPGQNWPRAIERAIRVADFFLAAFSRHSVSKRGQFQAEMRFAIESARKMPEDDLYFIPLRLDDCGVPDFIGQQWQWIDLFPDWEQKADSLAKVIREEARRRQLRSLHNP